MPLQLVVKLYDKLDGAGEGGLARKIIQQGY